MVGFVEYPSDEDVASDADAVDEGDAARAGLEERVEFTPATIEQAFGGVEVESLRACVEGVEEDVWGVPEAMGIPFNSFDCAAGWITAAPIKPFRNPTIENEVHLIAL